MAAPRVSVLIPLYNAARYIGATIESALAQTWPAVEVIVVDDGSRDGSVAEAERYAARGVRVIRQANAGPGAARNRALREATGSFIQYLDADDLLGPDKIAAQMARLADAPGAIASARWVRFYGERPDGAVPFVDEPVNTDLAPLDWLAASRHDGYGMMLPALWLIPRAVAAAAGPWNESLTRPGAVAQGEDAEYFTRVILAASRVMFCAGAHCFYRSGVAGSTSAQKSRQAWENQLETVRLCETYVRAREDSERVRRGFSLSFQHFAHTVYPYDRELAAAALDRARTLHPVVAAPDGGRAFRAATKLLGWRLARRLQVASGRA